MPRRHLRRVRATPLAPREEQIVLLLRERPHTAQELAQAFDTSVSNVRTSLSKLARKVPITALFRYGQTRYALEDKPSAEA